MKNSKLKRITSGMLAALVCAVSAPSASLLQANAYQEMGTKDGYDWELWEEYGQGQYSMTAGSNGTYSCSWSGIHNILFRSGKKWSNYPKWTSLNGIKVEYDVDYYPNGNSYLAIYGWMKDPTVEYYICEQFGSWEPPGNGFQNKGNATIDGKVYKILEGTHTGPSIFAGSETFKQYWSVKTNSGNSGGNYKGTITVSDHFAQWEKAGITLGGLYEVALNVEGWQSSGRADVKKNTLTLGGGNGGGGGGSSTTTPTESDGKFFKSTFESGTDNWTGRGAASVTTDSNNYYAGSKSLYVSGRTDNWNGGAVELSTNTFIPGQSYSFSAGVLQRSGESTSMKMTLQYKDSSGTENYDEIVSATAKSGEWTKLENTAYTIPEGATDLLLYIEAPDSLTDFYVDNFAADKKGTASSVTTGGGTAQSGTSNGGGNNGGNNGGGNGGGTVSSSDSLKGKFGSLFKMGTSVSPRELSSGGDFIKKHFNSITPENELKPDSILKQGSSDNTRCNVSLANAAQTLKFCEQNGIAVRGHTFVWYSQTPDWFFKENFNSNGAYVSKDIMNKRLENFIKDTFDLLKKEYPNLNVYAYDVCNELFVNDGGGLRPGSNSGWTRVYGDNNDEFILNAFAYARKYAPAGCKLYVNDYNEYITAKTNDIYNIAMKVKAQGNIDGIGMQSHLATNFPTVSQYETALKKFISTGLDVQITELDIETKGNDSARAKMFKDIFQLAVDNYENISSFTVWGTHDSISWRSSESPLLFGSNYTPKDDYKQVMSISVPNVGNTTTTTTTQSGGGNTTSTSTTTSSNTVSATLPGDANCDGKVNMADAVLIMQSLANPSKYKLSEEGKANADVNLAGNGVTSADALAIQKYCLKLLDKLPESVSSGGSSTTTTKKSTTTTTTTAAANVATYTEKFNSGAGDWESRGSASVALEKETYYSAGSSLKVSGRGDTWQGAQLTLPSTYKAGGTYSFSAAVLQATGSSQPVKMTLQYTDASGTDNYDEIASVTAADKTWTKLENTAYTIPSDATSMILYVELTDSTGNYYLDDVQIATSGTKSSVVTGQGTVGEISTGGGSATVDPSKKMMAISFDDGTKTPGRTIINALADEGFAATFFYVGDWITDESQVRYAYEKGMEVANHTQTHPHLTQSGNVKGEADSCHNKLKNIIGTEPSRLLRLPYLESNSNVQSQLSQYPLITCAIDTQDWNGASTDQIVNTVKQAMSNGSGDGAIVLCHETYDTTANAIKQLAPYMKAQGWQIVTISDMFAAKGKTLQGGQIYTRA